MKIIKLIFFAAMLFIAVQGLYRKDIYEEVAGFALAFMFMLDLKNK